MINNHSVPEKLGKSFQYSTNIERVTGKLTFLWIWLPWKHVYDSDPKCKYEKIHMEGAKRAGKRNKHLQWIHHRLLDPLSSGMAVPRAAIDCCPSKSIRRNDDSNVQNGRASSPLHSLSSQYVKDTFQKSKRKDAISAHCSPNFNMQKTKGTVWLCLTKSLLAEFMFKPQLCKLGGIFSVYPTYVPFTHSPDCCQCK